MVRSRTPASLDLDQDDRALRREWLFERVGWGMIGLVLAAGFSGALGDGPLASATVASADGKVVVAFDRIVRHGSSSEIELRLAPTDGMDTVVVVSLDEQYLSDLDMQHVSPTPLRVRASAGRVEYHLLRLDPIQPMRAVFSMQSGAAGPRRATLGTSHGTLELRQFVLP